MKKNLKSNELALFFLLAFVSQIIMFIWVSHSFSSNNLKTDSEISYIGEMSDDSDADEGDFNLIQNELEKELFSIDIFQIKHFSVKRFCFPYKQQKSDFTKLKNHLPPEFNS